MATLNDYFRTEAREFIAVLERGLRRPSAPDATELHRAVRGLRGTAQLARERRVFEVAAMFEAVTRPLAAGAIVWSDDLAQRARATVGDLRVLLEAREDDESLDGRVSVAQQRWREAAEVAIARVNAASASDDGGASDVGDASNAPGKGDASSTRNDGAGTREFREFAAREAAGIAEALDRGVIALQVDPMDREPLRTILRRQGALLGAKRLEELPIVGEVLRAVEDITRVVVKLDVGVKREWLDVYRVARDAIQSTVEPLLNDELPEQTHAVSRLRHMHAELTERYGDAGANAPTNGLVDPAIMTPVAVASPKSSETQRVPAPETRPVAPFVARSTMALRPVMPVPPMPAPPVATPPVATPPVATPTVATPTVATPTLATPTLATPTLATPTVATPVAESASVVTAAADTEPELTLDELAYDDEPEFAHDDESALAHDDEVDLAHADEVDLAHADEVDLAHADAPAPVFDDDLAYDAGESDVAEIVLDLDESSVVAIEREGALDRALDMEDAIMSAVEYDPRLRDAIAELFDLIRAARG